MTDETDIQHPGGDPSTLRLSALQQDILYDHLMETIEDAPHELQPVLDDIIDQLPEHEVLQRPPSMETLVEAGYFDQPPREADL